MPKQVFISGSKDKQIKFWHQNNQTTSFDWTCWQTITEHTDQIYGLSISYDGNKLVSCGRDGLILVMQKDNTQFWQVQQKIYKAIGFRLSFIDNEMFAFQPLILHNHRLRASQNLLVYSWNSNSRCYFKSKQISIKGEGQWCHIYFPQTYIPSKQILMAKNGQTVNLIGFSKTTQDYNYKLEQVFDYSNQFHKVIYQGQIFGAISDDGEYLILWDRNSSQIQIRQFKEYL
ncbi:unnamed protein product [Paramecium octaurelia]|uniref:Uncharacterized protein n=1 Tax=Paramecium octaurelia TaxID=43137 RepID=A0A8S1TAY4_PAROT|nr:unnamed protein product [Paramecium octaurelia]